MSRRNRSGERAKAAGFAALGDETRLSLLAKLGNGQRRSITELTKRTRLTRQAVTKHLRVLQSARILHGTREGRESLFQLNPQPIHEMREYLEVVCRQWDAAVERLKTFVQSEPQ